MPIVTFHPKQSKPVNPVVLQAALHKATTDLAAQYRPRQQVLAVRKPDEDLLPVGNLHRINQFALPPALKKTDFFALYYLDKNQRGSFAVKPYLFYMNLCLAATMSGHMDVLKELAYRKYTKRLGNAFKDPIALFRSLMIAKPVIAHLKVKKNPANKTVEATIPIGAVNAALMKSVYTLLIDDNQGTEDQTIDPSTPKQETDYFINLGQGSEGGNGGPQRDKNGDIELNIGEGASVQATIQISELLELKNPYLSPIILNEMKKFVQRIRVVSAPGGSIVLMDVILSELVVSSLTTESFVNADPLDIYNVLHAWLEGGKTDKIKKPADFMVPLSKIKRQNPPAKDFRLNEDGITVDQVGRFMVIPKEADHVDTHKSLVTNQLLNEDGSYCALDDSLQAKKLDQRQSLLYVDWVNMKVVYTTLEGRVRTINLDRCQPAKVSQIASMYRKPIVSNDYLLGTLSQCFNAAIKFVPEFSSFTSSEGVDNFKSALMKLAGTMMQEGTIKGIEDIRIYDFIDSAEPIMIGFMGAMKELDALLAKDVDIAYSQYSVTGTFALQAMARILAKYDDAADISGADQESRKKYINQKEDPDYQPPSLPLIRNGKEDPDRPLAVIPHQKKTLNLLKDSPDLAVLGIDAGGGKSLLSVLDYIKEIKEGNVDRALVIAPDHLVSTHIKEIADFTKGRMNAIPITSYTFRRHGLEKLKNLIEKRPINTVIVCSMGILNRTKRICYGENPVEVYFVAEWLRQFNFDFCVVDESHFLKSNSQRTRAVHRLLAGIKKKRIMSGTFVPNQIQDVVRQFALLDPTVFGSEEDFINEFAEEKKGNRVTKWKPGTELMVAQRIRENSVYVQVKRKEWAALLPNFVEQIHTVDMTPAQLTAYESILKSELERLEQNEPKLAKSLRRLIDKMQGKEVEASDDEDESEGEDAQQDDNEDDIADRLESLLRPYLQRMEMFCTSPTSDPLGKIFTGADAVSAKLQKLLEICRKHVESNTPGKIIVFTNYVESATAAVAFLEQDPQFKGKVIHYTAGQKEECISRFDSDPSKIIMVGVGDSMDTGLNLQRASRLIRAEGVWTPGKYEQGNSRINRPNLKNKEERSNVYVDILLASQSIDITKNAFLMTKIVSAEKFYNAGNPLYDSLEVPELFKMTLENIFSLNSELTLQDHFDKFAALRYAQNQDYAAYRQTHGKLEFTPLERAPNPPGSKLILRVPYEPGLELYGADKLGLIRYDKFMNLNEEELAGDDEDEKEDLSTKAKSAAEFQHFLKVSPSTSIHTEYGDGELVRVSKRRLTIKLFNSQEKVVVHKLAAFIITRKNTSGKDIRVQLAKLNGELPIDTPTEVPAGDDETSQKVYKRKQKETVKKQEEAGVSVNLSFTVFNSILTLSVDNASADGVADVMRQFGFRNPPSYIYTPIRRTNQFLAFIYQWRALGLTMPKDTSSDLKKFWDLVQHQALRSVSPHEFARANDLRLFLRENFRPNGDSGFIQPFLLVEDDRFNLALPFQGHAGTRVVIRESQKLSKYGGLVPRWKKVEPEEEMFCFVGGKNGARNKIKEILDSGIVIGNKVELLKDFKTLKFRARKGD
jgi:hypothetical protein